MSNAKNNFPAFSVVVKVNDLDTCRAFYRDLLDLGEPSIDSSFAVRFTLSDDFCLILEKVSAPFLEHASAATCWSFECSDIPALSKRLDDCGYAPLTPLRGSCRTDFYRGRDPENNVFLVRERPRENR